MVETGKLDHINIPKSALLEALERKSENKYSFEGIINAVGVKSYTLDEIEALSNQFGSAGRHGPVDGTFNINPLNATGGFS
jgi:hypothetical protein